MSLFGDLLKQKKQIGFWQALASPYSAEICAGAGFDWLLFDGEHAPNTLQTLLSQLQAISGHSVHPVARPPVGEPWMIKQYLDLGFPTLLIPMVESAEQATRLVQATRFPPDGVRGVASATSRASRFGEEAGYLAKQKDKTGLIVQIESAVALANIREIAAVEGVDALFIGPADLSAALGHLGNPRHPEVQTAIREARMATEAMKKPVGIFALDIPHAKECLAQGFDFVSIGTDIGILATGARTLQLEVREGLN